MNSTGIEQAFETLWENLGHDIQYLSMSVGRSELGCKKCLKFTTVETGRGGWLVTNRTLDKECPK